MLDEARALARASFFFFVNEVVTYSRRELGRKNLVTEHFHKPLCDLIQAAENPKQLVLVPRGCLKTAIISVAYPLWLLVNDPQTTILLASETVTLAEHVLREIKAVIERNTLFRVLFPELIPVDTRKTKWSETEIVVPRPLEVKEASIQTIGVGGT